MLAWVSRHLAFPLWELKDRAQRRRYLRELSASQWLDSETLYHQQWERLKETIKYAFLHCPYYRKRFAAVGFEGILRDRREFQGLPFLTKDDIRENGDGLLSRDFDREDLVLTKTGGSTGVALKLYFDGRCQEKRNAAAIRSNRWANWDVGSKVAALWGNPPPVDTFKKKLRNLLLDRIIYLDTMNIDEGSVRRFVGAWRREEPRILFGHSHSIYIFAIYLRRMGVSDLCPNGIVATSMMLLESERRLIEEVFQCRVTNRYGCEEVGLIACECERHEGFHLNVDHLVIEFLREDGSEAGAGEEGNIVITDLINRGMPLIRYRVEDMGVPSDRFCSCGRGLPLMERITGRQADFLKRPDGSLVAGVSLVERTLTAIPGIAQMQLVQQAFDRVCVKLVKDGPFDDASERMLRNELQSVFGDSVRLELQYVPVLDQTGAGKYRFAICNV